MGLIEGFVIVLTIALAAVAVWCLVMYNRDKRREEYFTAWIDDD